MDAHILNGDALAYKFPIEGEVIVARECLIEGPVRAESMEEFWKNRATYIHESFLENESHDYDREVKAEFEKLLSLEAISGINLWFEHDLFCQVNMWFALSYLKQNNVDLPLYRVMPSPHGANVWSGFGRMKNSDLQRCYVQRITLKKNDVDLATDLWRAYCEEDLTTLQKLSTRSSACFPLLEETCNAHLQRFPLTEGRPQQRLKQIMASGRTNFSDIFIEFQKTEGVYGFGDLQVKNMLAALSDKV